MKLICPEPDDYTNLMLATVITLAIAMTEVPVGAHVFRDPRFHLLLDPLTQR